MNDTAEQKLEELLKSRPFIPARDDLANRIVTAARSLTQKKDEPLVEWLHGLFGDFIALKPAYTLGLFLALGITLGFVGAVQNVEDPGNNMDTNQMQDFLYVKRSFL